MCSHPVFTHRGGLTPRSSVHTAVTEETSCPHPGCAQNKYLHWLPVRARISCKTACLRVNTITSSISANLSDLLHLYSPSLCSSADTRLLKIPLYKCKTKGDRAFSYLGPSVWNSLPLHIRNATTLDSFMSALNAYLFNFKESN